MKISNSTNLYLHTLYKTKTKKIEILFGKKNIGIISKYFLNSQNREEK